MTDNISITPGTGANIAADDVNGVMFQRVKCLMDIATGGTFTGPLKLDYTPGTSTEIGMFNTPQSDLFLRFVGMNMADSGKIVTADLYKVNINPTKELSLITDDLAQMQIEGAALLDPTKPVNATLGQFGAIYQQ